MNTYSQTAEIMRAMIPVSRFNKGEAAKIFDEVEQAGIRVVIKNNKPKCVLFSLKRFEEIMEEIDDMRLLLESENRLNDSSSFISADDVMHQLGISQDDLDAAGDVEIE